MEKTILILLISALITITNKGFDQNLTYPVTGTAITACFDTITEIPCPTVSSDPFFGQYHGTPPSFQDNGNGTITDLNTGLTWQSSPDANGNNNEIIEKADKLTWSQIQARPAALNAANYGGYNDWRVPSIKELYSLTNWNGTDPSGFTGNSTTNLIPFIDTTYFPFAYGQTNLGERIIDSQYASCNLYNEADWDGFPMLFGFNFADGRIKGYGLMMPGGIEKTFFLLCVRGNTSYGINKFKDNGDNTISDSATGLMWTKDDSPSGMNWQATLAWAQTMNTANYCGYHDWRLPNTKELQSIVDYTRSPKSTNSPAIDSIFHCTQIIDEAGYTNWPWYWTSATHRSYDGITYAGANGIYICFGAAFGWMQRPGNTYYSLVDVHGAGAQRSSPKCGTYLGDPLGVDSLGNIVYGRGPQGDVLRVNNYVRLVRDIDTSSGINEIQGNNSRSVVYPNPFPKEATIKIYSNEKIRKAELLIYDIYGNKVRSIVGINSNEVKIDRQNMSSGIYLYRITGNGNLILTGKLIVEEKN